jgi:hypothetical protein
LCFGEAALVESLAAGIDEDGAHVAHVVVDDLLGHLESVLQKLTHAERVAVADEVLADGEDFRVGVSGESCVFDRSCIAADPHFPIVDKADDAGHGCSVVSMSGSMDLRLQPICSFVSVRQTDHRWPPSTMPT